MDHLIGSAAALSSAAIWAVSSTLLTAPARRFGGHATNVFKCTFAAGLFVLTVLCVFGPHVLALPRTPLILFAASGICGLALGDTAYLIALKHIGPTSTAIIYQSSAVFTPILGVCLFHETINLGQGCGIALVVGGVLLATVTRGFAAEAHGSWSVGLVAALLASVGQTGGILLTTQGFSSLRADRVSLGLTAAFVAATVRMTAASAGTLSFSLLQGRLPKGTLPLRTRDGWRMLWFPAFIGTYVAMIFMQVSQSKLPGGTASVLLSMTPIFTIPVAWWLVRERPTWRRGVGAALAVAGAAWLSAA